MNIERIKYIVLILTLLHPLLSQAAVDKWTESYRLENLAQFDAAARVMQDIIEKEGKNEFAVLRQGWLNYMRGEHGQSIENYKDALSINAKSLDALIGITLPLIAQQRWNEVTSYTDKALKVAPWNYYAHVRLMIAEEGLRKWDALARHAREVHLRYPSDATILVYLARAYRWLGKSSDARDVYRQVLQRVPGHVEATQFVEGASL